ncbi:MAG: response regulator transcription factor [Verrucomicrobiota bacterium]
MSRIRLVIADDHYVVRLGLQACLGLKPEIEIVGFAEDGQEAIDRYQEFRPDVLLMDARMPRLDGPAATRLICGEFPSAKILILSAFAVEQDVRAAIQAGAHGYIVKTSSPDELVAAIVNVAGGRQVFPPEIQPLIDEINDARELSERQITVLEFLAKGLTNREIAALMGIGENGVKAHLKSLFNKLQAADRTEAVAVALQRGILR